MRRADLEHVIRAAAELAGDDEIVVIGSQAILGQFPDAPSELLESQDADVYPRRHPMRRCHGSALACQAAGVLAYRGATASPVGCDLGTAPTAMVGSSSAPKRHLAPAMPGLP